MHANETHWDYQAFFDASKRYVRADKTKKYIRTWLKSWAISG